MTIKFSPKLNNTLDLEVSPFSDTFVRDRG